MFNNSGHDIQIITGFITSLFVQVRCPENCEDTMRVEDCLVSVGGGGGTMGESRQIHWLSAGWTMVVAAPVDPFHPPAHTRHQY